MFNIIFSIVLILAFLILFYVCYINKHINLNLTETIDEDFANKLLDIKTNDKKALPYFSENSKRRIKEQWIKLGYIQTYTKVIK